MAGKDGLFAQLKPASVALSEAVLTLSTPSKDIRGIETRLEALDQVVRANKGNPQFDNRLADYVFFPVAQILKHSRQASLRSLELCLSIIAVLITSGWRDRIEEPLAQQLLILCTLLASRHPPLLSTDETSPELQANALDCLQALFSIASANASKSIVPATDDNIPQIGQSLSIILEDLRDSDDPELQTSAIAALGAFVRIHWPSQLLWNFLPGILSTLTRVARPQTKHHRSPSTIVSSLDIFRQLVTLAFNDEKVASLPAGKEEVTSQVRNALGSLTKLISHDKNAVREALSHLFISILEDCSKVLSNSIDLAVETIVTISARTALFRLSILVSHDHAIRKTLQSALYDWSASLVRVMQSSDEEKMVRRIAQIQSAYTILGDAKVDRTTIDQHLERCLIDGLTVLLHGRTSNRGASDLVAQHKTMNLTASRDSLPTSLTMSTVMTQEKVADSIVDLLRVVCPEDEGQTFLQVQSRSLLYASGDAKLARLWLVLAALETQVQQHEDTDQYLQLDNSHSGAFLSVSAMTALETAYALALDILGDNSGSTVDSRLKRLAVRTLALRARVAGRDFRYELVEALYPILDTLAAPDNVVREDSLAALNMITTACGYDSVPDLIIDNVDYLTNAVALKLNSFDVSPQGPQILLMMVQLAGPGLLPYLEDTVESIFAALEDYHGYPLLVELLFKALSVMAQEGQKTPALAAIHNAIAPSTSILTEPYRPLTIDALSEMIRDHVSDELAMDTSVEDESEAAPQQPWTSGAEQDSEDVDMEVEKPGPAAPKVYGLLLKILDLTQHYLPSGSPSLRLSLLTLIATTVPAIATHEDSFLPLINTLWPEIVARLDDDETAVRAAALDAIATLCENAKDFMRSRISDLWPRIRAIWTGVAQVAKELDSSATPPTGPHQAFEDMALVRTSARRGDLLVKNKQAFEYHGDTIARRLASALLNLVVVVVRYVSISAEHFDEALEMVKSQLSDATVFEAFNSQNADAVWLCQMKAADSSAETTGAVLAV